MSANPHPRINIKKHDNNDHDDVKFNSCDTCINGIVTKNGVTCGRNLALVCKPGLLENPKYYHNWEKVIG